MRTNEFLAGIFTLQLLLSGCQKEESEPIEVRVVPKAEFSCQGPFAAGDSTRFLNSSSNATKYRWSFGDGNMSTKAVPAHVYRQSGRFNVQLQAINAPDTARYTLNVDITLRPPAGYTCDCMVTTQSWSNTQGTTGPIVRQPDEQVAIGAFTDVRGGIGFSFKEYNYTPAENLNTSTYRYYYSTINSVRQGGVTKFYPATDSVITTVTNGTSLSGIWQVYRCKKR